MFSYAQKVFERVQILFCESRFPLSSEVIIFYCYEYWYLEAQMISLTQPRKPLLCITCKLTFLLFFFFSSVRLLWLLSCFALRTKQRGNSCHHDKHTAASFSFHCCLEDILGGRCCSPAEFLSWGIVMIQWVALLNCVSAMNTKKLCL